MSRTLDLDKILDHILETVGRVTPYDGANILLVESDLVRVARQKGYIDKGVSEEWQKLQIPITKLTVLQQMIQVGKAMAIPDTSASPLWIGYPELEWVNSNVIAPIRTNGKILGFLSLDSATPGYFTQAHAERLQTFADQAAIAIQNARLLDRAKHAAVMAERNRMANELHDTISQTLWSMSLITERLPAIWDIDIDEGRRGLTTLHRLSQNALTEMRSLLLELHPASLTEAKLGDLITQVAEVITTRTEMNISVQIDNQEPIPPNVHFALYRVVQEALNNIVVHASASHVEIYVNSQSGHVELTIQDNGTGFNPDDIDPGHLGLSIMRDRVQNVGGTIEIISQNDRGTLIKITWIAPAD
jgi:signal transduction histidine kinase